MQFPPSLFQLAATLALSLRHLTTQAAAGPRLCVFDIVGTAGDAYNMTKDHVVAMQRHGVTIELKVPNVIPPSTVTPAEMARQWA